MALNIGELVAGIRADDQGWRHGLADAQIRLAGFTRMADGSLRDLHGNVVSRSDAMAQTLGRSIRDGANDAIAALKKIAPAAAKIAAGIPAAAALTVALGGLAAGAVAAGLAVGAFKLAAKPQLEAVAEATKAAETADSAHEKALLKKNQAQALASKGGDAYKKALVDAAAASKTAKDADAALAQQLAGLPPATREYATSLAALKNEHEDWSNSLSSTTMPVFTKGIQILRDLLPTLTPFVKAAAEAFSGLLDKVAVGVKSAGFKQWAADMAAASGPMLTNFITAIGNIAKGFGGLLQAFLPASAGVTGGLVSMTAAFANWGTSLKGSKGFEQFVDLAKEGAGMLKTLGTAALQVLVALSPLIGITAQLAMWFAQLVNAIPPDKLTAIATGIAAIVLAVKAYALYVRIAAAVTRAWAIAQGIFNVIMMMNPVGLVIAAIVALIAVVVIAYQKSETFRDIVQGVWEAIKTGIKAAVDFVVATVQWFSQLPGKLSGWFTKAKDAVILKMAQMVIWLQGLPGRVISSIASLGGKLWSSANAAFQRFRDAAATKAIAFIGWVKGMPGRIASSLGSLNNLLYDKGMDIVRGLWNGIKSMGGWLRDTLMGWAKSVIPAPIAKALGIGSPSKLMADQVGQWIPAGVVEGIKDGQGAVDKTMANLVNPQRAGMGSVGGTAGAAAGAMGGRGGQTTLRIVVEGPEAMTKLIRTIVKNDGRGDVQVAFGR